MLARWIGLIQVLAICSAQKTPIFIYYESLCPDSQAFITNQLYPTMTGAQNLSRYLDIKFIPYGKSTTQTQGSDVKFDCHHGENECYGNKIHSCAINNIQVNSFQNEHTRESQTLEYINCLMKPANNFKDKIYPGGLCATATGITTWNSIENCANSTDGSKALQKNGELTDTFQSPLKSVPTVTFRNTYDSEFQNQALDNFRAAVCKRLTPVPAECNSTNNSGDKNVAAILVLAITFGLSRLFVA